MVDNLLHEHVELPRVLDLAVHLVHLTTWKGRECHPETFFLEFSFMLKSYGWGGVGWVAHVILVSPQSQLDLEFNLGLLCAWVWV